MSDNCIALPGKLLCSVITFETASFIGKQDSDLLHVQIAIADQIRPQHGTRLGCFILNL